MTRREDEELMHADRELADFVYNCRKLCRIYMELQEITLQLNTFGVSSPKIMSIEEAKYQKGTRVYSDVPLLEIFAREDELMREYKFLSDACSRIKMKLARMNLSEQDLKIMYLRYEKGLTFDRIAEELDYSRQRIQWRIETILNIYNAL